MKDNKKPDRSPSRNVPGPHKGRSRYKVSHKKVLAEPGVSARFLALEALQDSTLHALPTDRIGPLADRYRIAERERPLAYEILCGTIKRRASLDVLIERVGGRRCKSIEPGLLNIIRIGVYQLVFLEHVPRFAAVDLGGKLASLYGAQRQVNFVNAILRNVARAIEVSDAPIVSEYARNTMPLAVDRGVRFGRKILPPEDKATKYLAAAYSYPEWLVRRWLPRFGFDKLKTLLAAGNARPATVCRPNLIKFAQRYEITDIRQAAVKLSQLLEAEGCRTRMLGKFGAVQIAKGPSTMSLEAFRDGLFQLQNITSQQIVHALGLGQGQKILDLCAGLGTKTTQIAELTLDRCKVYATDSNEAKLEKLLGNAGRLGIAGIETLELAAVTSGRYDDSFDVVLADVPCSNTGVLASRPEVRWRLKPADLAMFARSGLKLLATSSKLIVPGGKLGYSTCSIDTDENEQVVHEFTRRPGGWKLIEEHTEYPTTDASTGRVVCEGGYWAVLQRE